MSSCDGIELPISDADFHKAINVVINSLPGVSELYPTQLELLREGI